MREILFRGKRVDNGEWVYGSLLKQAGEYISKDEVTPNECWICGMRGEKALIVSETVGQYTGLKDKNNVDAFEGDIVVCNQSGSYGISVIIYDNSAFYVMPLNGNILERTLWDYWYNDWDIEVIGNIHDNPELLEVKEHE